MSGPASAGEGKSHTASLQSSSLDLHLPEALVRRTLILGRCTHSHRDFFFSAIDFITGIPQLTNNPAPSTNWPFSLQGLVISTFPCVPAFQLALVDHSFHQGINHNSGD